MGNNLSDEFLRKVEKRLSLEEKFEKVDGLEGGISTSCHLLTTKSNKSFVLRVYPKNREKNYSKREFEILTEIQNYPELSNLAPKPFYYDSSKTDLDSEYLIQSFLKSDRTLKIFGDEDIINDPRVLEKIGQTLRLFHEKLPKFKFNQEEVKEDQIIINENKFVNWEDKSIEKIFLEQSMEMETKFNLSDFKSRAFTLLQKTKMIEKKHFSDDDPTSFFMKEDRNRNSRIHGDFHPGNLLLVKKNKEIKIKLVDWESSSFGSVYEDLSRFIVFSGLSDENEKIFLNSYFNDNNNNKNKNRINQKFLDCMKIKQLFIITPVLFLISLERLSGKRKEENEENENEINYLELAVKYFNYLEKLILEF